MGFGLGVSAISGSLPAPLGERSGSQCMRPFCSICCTVKCIVPILFLTNWQSRYRHIRIDGNDGMDRYAPSQVGPANRLQNQDIEYRRSAEILAGGAPAPGKGVAEMRDDNYHSLRCRREACRCFPLFRAVIPLLSAGIFRAKSHVRQRVSGKSARKRGLSAARLLLRPGISAKEPRMSAGSPPRFIPTSAATVH